MSTENSQDSTNELKAEIQNLKDQIDVLKIELVEAKNSLKHVQSQLGANDKQRQKEFKILKRKFNLLIRHGLGENIGNTSDEDEPEERVIQF